MFKWIRGESKRHRAFNANRVGEIPDTADRTKPVECQWNGSRGLPVTAITSESRWLNGPIFLSLLEERWPKGNFKLESSNQQ